MQRITRVEELTDEVVAVEIRALLDQARDHVATRNAQLVLGGDFQPSQDDLREGPIGRKMQAIFAFVRGSLRDDRMHIAELSEEVLEFLWSSVFVGHYQIPDEFWERPLGFAIYEVIGRFQDAGGDKELTSAQAAKYLSISQDGLRALTEQGRIKTSTLAGGHARYRVADLDAIRPGLGGSTS